MAASAKKVQNKVNLVSYCIKTLTLNLHAGLQHVICKSRGLLWSFFKWSTWNIFKLVHFSKNGYPLVLIQKIIFVHLFSFFGNFKTDHFIKLIIFLIQLTKIFMFDTQENVLWLTLEAIFVKSKNIRLFWVTYIWKSIFI